MESSVFSNLVPDKLIDSTLSCRSVNDTAYQYKIIFSYLLPCLYTMRICPEDLSSLNERLNGRHIRYFSGATARMLMMFIAWGER